MLVFFLIKMLPRMTTVFQTRYTLYTGDTARTHRDYAFVGPKCLSKNVK